ncbi:MAG: trypsin-like peptidase domain-containing protein [Armatimonadetes bacterium]|nr:trypsin-like peptidase domain-containing protein [Armatimonadota bacterium]
MISLLLALLMAAGPDPNTVRVEAALFLPRAGVTLAADPIVVYDASGVVLMPMLRANQLAALFDGTNGRFVTSAATSLAAGATAVMLPMSASELMPSANAAQRQMPNAGPDLSGLRVDVSSAQALPRGARLGLILGLTQAATAQEAALGQQQRVTEDMVFRRRQVRTELTLTYDQPFAVLLDSGQGLARANQTMRQQIGNQQIEARGALVGVVLHLVPAGAPLLFDGLVPPVAPPGHVRVSTPDRPSSNLIYRDGMRVTDALAATGLQYPGNAALSITRLQPNGLLDRYDAQSLPLTGTELDLPLRERDSLTLALPATKSAPSVATVPRSLGGGAGGAGGAGVAVMPGPASMAGAAGGLPGPVLPPGAPATAPTTQALRAEVMRSMSVDELRQLAPAAAQASRAVVSLRGLAPGDPPNQVLLAGTLVSADGLCIAAPAQTILPLAQLRAQLPDGREVRATVVNTDLNTGLVLLRLTDGDRALHGLGYLKLNAMMPAMGTPLLVAGNPLGLMGSVNLTVVAGPRRRLAEAPGAELQLDAPLATGISGGPIVDLTGRVVAIAYGTLREGDAGPGIGLAVPAEYAVRLMGSTKH